jgi:hypothetical protein
MQENDSQVAESLARLARKTVTDILTLPIHIVNNCPYCRGGKEHTCCPAWTTTDGIFLIDKIVKDEPENIEVYLAHEIFHHVIHDSSATHQFNPTIVNLAEDYKINHLIEKLFGYDVKAVKTKGLRNKKLGKLKVAKIAEILSNSHNLETSGCYTQKGLLHPTILNVVNQLRRKFRREIKSADSLFLLDDLDKKRYLKVAGAASRQLKAINEIGFVDLQQTIEGVWAHLYLDHPVHNSDSTKLTPAEALTFAFPSWLFRSVTKGASEESVLAATLFLKQADRDRFYKTLKIAYYKGEIDRLRLALSQSKKSRRQKRYQTWKVSELREALAFAKRRFQDWTDALPLEELLQKEIIEVIPKQAVVKHTTPTCLRQVVLAEEEDTSVTIPDFKANDTSRQITRVARRSMREFDSVVELFKKLLEKFGNDITNEDDEGEDEPGDETKPGDGDEEDGDGEGDQEGDTKGDGDKEEGDSGDGDKGEEGENGQKPSKGKKKGGQGQESDGLGGPGQSGLGAGQGGRGCGKGKGRSKSKVELLLQIAANLGDIEDIIFSMEEIEALLSKKTQRKTAQKGVDVTYEYGNDIERVDASELALLADKSTELLFFAKLADGTLLQRCPLQQRKYPCIMLIDGSGSMGGKRYQTASGFALALIRQLHLDQRGSALLTFSDGITGEVVIEANGSIHMANVLDVVSKPEMGGTNFNKAFERAFEIKKEQKWNSCVIILISDGCDYVDDKIQDLKGPNDKILCALTDRGIEGVKNVADQIFVMDRRDKSNLSLIPIANEVL